MFSMYHVFVQQKANNSGSLVERLCHVVTSVHEKIVFEDGEVTPMLKKRFEQHFVKNKGERAIRNRLLRTSPHGFSCRHDCML